MKTSFAKVFVKNILASADYNLTCPYPSGQYTISNYTFNVIPRMPLPANVFICLTEKYFCKTSDRKSMHLVATINGKLSYA
jgi:Protein of unknown function (DUF1091)